jgi:Zn-finger nucleic acid-binding protein
MSDRQGVEIDYCPKCRGVWLDRGELDKIIELSAFQRPPAAGRRPDDSDDDRDDRELRDDRDRTRRRRKSVLGELFDF